jgi:hypothetical protein
MLGDERMRAHNILWMFKCPVTGNVLDNEMERTGSKHASWGFLSS